MNGIIALVGSGEFLETMDAIDRHLLAHAPAQPARVACVPAAAGEEGEASVSRWAEMGVAHFTRLGAQAECARITDRASADDPRWATMLESADLIYFSGGDPLYLYRTMQGTRAWAAAERAWARGAVYAGCSAGAMILGALVPDVQSFELPLYPAFNRLPGCLIMPHFDQLETYRPGATALLQSRLADGQYGLGIDEHTALVGRLQNGAAWEVLGRGGVSILTPTEITVYQAGEKVRLPNF
jgi:cyanophycinase